ncbi:Sfk1p Ecym_2310 [Eremothecium cymbalariae DBVPG|uniref:CWH43-like N-terminal domain-containing protein n=2 Tax=Eremothecium cymbalariae TaxID=45285 RepID=G8JQ50_ERECY|nr:Hypothetical protein Ecym_2310 [Eremothecium cymbalariae DBVPG\
MAFPKPANPFFIVPWMALLPWYGMLIAMLVSWAVQGHPRYWFMSENANFVYISDIGATKLQPLFIAGSSWQGFWYCVSVACEYFQRSGHWPFIFLAYHRASTQLYPMSSSSGIESAPSVRVRYADLLVNQNYLMPPYYTVFERNMIVASFFFGVFGELALLMCSIFSTAKHHTVHLTMVGLFIALMYFSILCNLIEYFSMGRHYALLHPLAGPEIRLRKTSCNHWPGHIWNKFTISAIFKTIWLALATLWAIFFGKFNDSSVGSSFEWVLAFWLGIYLIIVCVDFYLGGRYKESKYFRQIESFEGHYKYDRLVLGEVKMHLEQFAQSPARPHYSDADELDIVV